MLREVLVPLFAAEGGTVELVSVKDGVALAHRIKTPVLKKCG